jgi:adenosylmethionine-8-amino-7-oxononanoate aminotransferase
MTGFFRTGKMFTCEHISDDKISYVPDIMCVSKGITGGFLPLALTITSEDIYCAFLGNSDECTFLHGHSYTANPIGCAAAMASFDLLQRDECKQNIAMINGVHLQWHKKLGNHKFIRYHRILGTISAFEISDDIYDKMDIIAAKMLEAGFLIRPLRNVVYLIPPYCTSYDNLNASYETLLNIIDEKML